MINAVRSIVAQEHPPTEIVVEIDHDRTGASATRNRGWRKLTTDWVAFLDDDDIMYPQHIGNLLDHAAETGADLVYPWFDIGWPPSQEPRDVLFIDGVSAEGRPFDERSVEVLAVDNFIPVTVLVKRAVLEEVGGFPTPRTEEWPHESCEDWGCWQRMLAVGAKFSHLPERTWKWNWHQHQTSGRGDLW